MTKRAVTCADDRDLGMRDLAIAGLIALGALALYVATLCPTIFVEDSAEFSTAVATFGVPHPPGYPLYTLMGGLFTRALPIGDLGLRSNLFSAAAGAGAAGVLWILMRRLGADRIAALAATIAFAVGRTFWSQCLAAEVHALNALLLALALLASFEAARAPAARTFVAAGLAIGLAIGHRNVNVLFLAPLFVVLARAVRASGRRLPLLACAVGALAASALIYAYLPLAARRNPALSMGAPVTLARFLDVVTAQAYVRHLGAGTFGTDLGRLGRFALGLPVELGVALVAAPVGFVLWRRRGERAQLGVVAWMAGACVLFAALYNVIDVDSYLIPAYLALAVAAGVGFSTWHGRARVVLPIVALAGVAAAWTSVSLRGTTIVRDYARQLIGAAPAGAIVLSFGDTETHVLTYEQAVEHARADVIVVSANEIAGWYVEQLARRHPDVAWPPTAEADEWLPALIGGARAARPICLTQPVPLGPESMRLVPVGLLYCLAPALTPRDLQRSVDLWRAAITPTDAERALPEVHVQMIAFAFAQARFALAAALAEIGDVEEAQAQLRAVVAAKPDVSERAIVQAMQTIGREGHHDLSLGRRAELALQLGPRDPRFLTLLRPSGTR
jgi:hypothetical protein